MTREEAIRFLESRCNKEMCEECPMDTHFEFKDCVFGQFGDDELFKACRIMQGVAPNMLREAFKLPPETDPVHPAHYMLPGGLQVIDVEVAMFGREWVMHHCICTAVEYLLRHRQKNGDEDVKKALWWMEEWRKLKEDGEDER